MLLGILLNASLLVNTLSGKNILRAGEETFRAS